MFVEDGNGLLNNLLPGSQDSIDSHIADSLTVIDEHGKGEFFRVHPMSIVLCSSGRDFPVVLSRLTDSDSCQPLLRIFGFTRFAKLLPTPITAEM